MQDDASDIVLPDNIEDVFYPGDDLIDVEALLDDDTFMSLAFQWATWITLVLLAFYLLLPNIVLQTNVINHIFCKYLW